MARTLEARLAALEHRMRMFEQVITVNSNEIKIGSDRKTVTLTGDTLNVWGNHCEVWGAVRLKLRTSMGANESYNNMVMMDNLIGVYTTESIIEIHSYGGSVSIDAQDFSQYSTGRCSIGGPNGVEYVGQLKSSKPW